MSDLVPAFMLMCFLSGTPQGQMYFRNMDTCNYFRDGLSNQTFRMGEETKNYYCWCKMIPEVNTKECKGTLIWHKKNYKKNPYTLSTTKMETALFLTRVGSCFGD